MWEITLSGQVSATLWSVPVGAALCLLYDLIRIVRNRLKTDLLFSVISDILFFVFAAFITFCIFLIFCSGQIRFYVFLGLLVGFLVFRFTISVFFMRFGNWLFSLIASLFSLVGRGISALFGLVGGVFSKKSVFALNILKKLLQPVHKLLYTLKVKKSLTYIQEKTRLRNR